MNAELGSTILMVTHNANTAAMADRVIYFADGGILKVVVNAEKLSPSEIHW